MPWHKHKNPKLVSHYGRWTKQAENNLYDSVFFEGWRGGGGLIPRGHSLLEKTKEVKDVDGANKFLKLSK